MGRIANFSSSAIYKLMIDGKKEGETGAAYKTYLKEKLREYRTGRSVNNQANAKSLNWGNFMEGWMFDNKLGLDYQLVSQVRYKHDTLLWSGMPDFFVDGMVGDIKNPFTINGFCDLVDSFTSVEAFKKAKPEYYWQLVSNAILCNCSEALLIVYMPYREDLKAIREAVNNYDGDAAKYAFISWSTDRELPFLVKDKYYKDINKFQFTVSNEDKEALINRVTMATKELKSLI